MTSRHLRMPLLANAAFSGAVGLLLTAKPSAVAGWMGLPVEWLYLLLGFGLLLFGAGLCIVAVRPRPIAVLAITAADVGWIAVTSLALGVWYAEFTPLGAFLILGTNAAVLAAAWFQQISIRKVFRVPGSPEGEYEVCIAVASPASAPAMWTVMSDLGGIRNYMQELRSSALTAGDVPGLGCVRRCVNLKGEIWFEMCEAWEPGRSFGVVFLTDHPEFPFPFSKMRGGWRVTPDGSGCQVQVWWRVVPQQPWAAALLLPLLAVGARRTFAGVVRRMTLAAQGGDPHSIPQHFSVLHAVAC